MHPPKVGNKTHCDSYTKAVYQTLLFISYQDRSDLVDFWSLRFVKISLWNRNETDSSFILSIYFLLSYNLIIYNV